ncbi:hypothetical protein ACFPMF_25450 [Larkinella bovis]|uniref:Uncharacterized protein n=1 Tax=Larkinella bovis TaxID=683041 RepID=A0ABW0IJU9_9BACT
MIVRSLFLLSLVVALSGCSVDKNLDSSIPRIQTPMDQIAYLRTKWKNGQHIETVFYDHHNRILEVYNFGLTNSKWLTIYEGDKPVTSIYFYHSDSAGAGDITIDTLRQRFDSRGRLVLESHRHASLSRFGNPKEEGFTKRYLAYSVSGDTIIKRQESSYWPAGRPASQVVDSSRWDRDSQKRIRRFYRLYVMKMPAEPQYDTVYHFSRQYAYDSAGRLKMAWFDSMYLGRFYIPAGPDTVWYHYNAQNRLLGERHRYTTDLRNKREIRTVALSVAEKQSVDWHKKNFFTGYAKNGHTDWIQYRYEVFNPEKHLPLVIPK